MGAADVERGNKVKKILILVSSKSDNKSKLEGLLNKHLKGSGVSLTTATFSELFFDISENKLVVKIGKLNIQNFDLIYLRHAGKKYSGYAISLAVYLEHLGIKYFDTIYGTVGPKTAKFTPLLRILLGGCAVPRTVYFVKPEMDAYYKYLVTNLGLPFVAKNIALQRGAGVFLVKNKTDFNKLPDRKGKDGLNEYMFQKLIDKDHEYRLLVLGQKIGVWEEKIAKDPEEFRNNVALGAREVFFDVKDTPKNISDIALCAAGVLSIQIAGVDVMTEKRSGKPYILEVNRGPGLTYDEKVSPEFAQIAKFFKSEIEKNSSND